MAQPAYTTCKKRGPYYPVGDVEWECLTHDVMLVRVGGEWGTDARRDEMVCPVAFDLDRRGVVSDAVHVCEES